MTRAYAESAMTTGLSAVACRYVELRAKPSAQHTKASICSKSSWAWEEGVSLNGPSLAGAQGPGSTSDKHWHERQRALRGRASVVHDAS